MTEQKFFSSPIIYLKKRLLNELEQEKSSAKSMHLFEHSAEKQLHHIAAIKQDNSKVSLIEFIDSIPSEKLHLFALDKSQIIEAYKKEIKLFDSDLAKLLIVLLNAIEGKFILSCRRDIHLDRTLDLLYLLFSRKTNKEERLMDELTIRHDRKLPELFCAIFNDLYFLTDINFEKITNLEVSVIAKLKNPPLQLIRETAIRQFCAEEYNRSLDFYTAYISKAEKLKIESEELVWDYLLIAESCIKAGNTEDAMLLIKKSEKLALTLQLDNNNKYLNDKNELLIKASSLSLLNCDLSQRTFQKRFKIEKIKLNTVIDWDIASPKVVEEMTSFERIGIRRIANELKPLLNEGKNLVYFASGARSNPVYKKLPYDNIILVDYNMPDIIHSFSKKVIGLRMDALELIVLFKILNLKIDCFVCINEGLYEGGGKYAINSDPFLGYALPVMSKDAIHIGCRDYYGGVSYHHLRSNYLDIPYLSKRRITKEHVQFINPKVFTSYGMGEISEVTSLENKSYTSECFKYKNLTVNIQHKSIWEDAKDLDALFVRYENSYQKNIIEKFEPKAYAIEVSGRNDNNESAFVGSKRLNYSVSKICELCEKFDLRSIGLVPNGGNYLATLDALSQSNMISEVNLYHLNKGDYSNLKTYLRSADSFGKEIFTDRLIYQDSIELPDRFRLIDSVLELKELTKQFNTALHDWLLLHATKDAFVIYREKPESALYLVRKEYMPFYGISDISLLLPTNISSETDLLSEYLLKKENQKFFELNTPNQLPF